MTTKKHRELPWTKIGAIGTLIGVACALLFFAVEHPPQTSQIDLFQYNLDMLLFKVTNPPNAEAKIYINDKDLTPYLAEEQKITNGIYYRLTGSPDAFNVSVGENTLVARYSAVLLLKYDFKYTKEQYDQAMQYVKLKRKAESNSQSSSTDSINKYLTTLSGRWIGFGTNPNRTQTKLILVVDDHAQPISAVLNSPSCTVQMSAFVSEGNILPNTFYFSSNKSDNCFELNYLSVIVTGSDQAIVKLFYFDDTSTSLFFNKRVK